jgi:hypothetical protein
LRRAAVLVLAFLTLAPAGVKAAAWFRSAQDGVLRTACCCPAKARYHGPTAPDSEVRAACCCTIVQLAARPAPERAAPPEAVVAAPAVARAVVAVPPPPRTSEAIPPDRPRPTRFPPALFVQHCALLL